MSKPTDATPRRYADVLLRKDVLAGLMFMAVAVLGLWLSRNYSVGTTLRMGTGYVPRLLCWVLLGLGALIAVRGVFETGGESAGGGRIVGSAWRPVIFVTASLTIFGLSLERLGLVVSIALLMGVGALAARGLRPVETVVATAGLIILSWAIFIVGLGITIPVWPEW